MGPSRLSQACAPGVALLRRTPRELVPTESLDVAGPHPRGARSTGDVHRPWRVPEYRYRWRRPRRRHLARRPRPAPGDLGDGDGPSCEHRSARSCNRRYSRAAAEPGGPGRGSHMNAGLVSRPFLEPAPVRLSAQVTARLSRIEDRARVPCSSSIRIPGPSGPSFVDRAAGPALPLSTPARSGVSGACAASGSSPRPTPAAPGGSDLPCLDRQRHKVRRAPPAHQSPVEPGGPAAARAELLGGGDQRVLAPQAAGARCGRAPPASEWSPVGQPRVREARRAEGTRRAGQVP
ncbi:hypothetical protein HNR30_009398 [Nonomuraea soli]|uniref:Uncharacterized protein n=1 Tax=Nonomuraea soli TaxID=1032476 RepID=A0A7W0CV87_9ACTN|nr:hypothetical protein [Nonomuraea soli]